MSDEAIEILNSDVYKLEVAQESGVFVSLCRNTLPKNKINGPNTPDAFDYTSKVYRKSDAITNFSLITI